MSQMTELAIGPSGEVLRVYNLGLPSVPYCLDLYWIPGYAIGDGESAGGGEVVDFTLTLAGILQRLLPAPGPEGGELPAPGPEETTPPPPQPQSGVSGERAEASTSRRLSPAYGGSDSTRSSFNRTRYVKGASVHAPIDVTLDPINGLVYSGMIGAEHGAQTIFLRFRTTEPSRVGLRRLTLNPYTDQYLDVSLRGADDRIIPLAADAATAPPEVIIAAAAQTRPSLPPTTTHADVGYWGDDYVQDPGGEAAQLPVLQGDVSSRIRVDDLSAQLSEVRPPGTYIVTITSSQWPRIPFRLQLLTREVASLRAVAEFTLDAVGRFTLRALAGAADLELEAEGRFSRLFVIGGPPSVPYCLDSYWIPGYAERDGEIASIPQIASFTLSPVATVQRLSPLQGLALGAV